MLANSLMQDKLPLIEELRLPYMQVETLSSATYFGRALTVLPRLKVLTGFTLEGGILGGTS